MIKAEDWHKVLKQLEELEETVRTLKIDNEQLKNQLQESTPKDLPKPGLSYKQVVCACRIDDETTICLLASARKETAEAIKRQKNLVISGLKPPTTSGSSNEEEDRVQIDNVLKKLEVNELEVRTKRRIRNKKDEQGNLVIVEMVDETSRNRALKNAPKLAGSDVFINRDMTQAEQAMERELRTERNLKNSKLENSNGKYRYGTDENNRN